MSVRLSVCVLVLVIGMASAFPFGDWDQMGMLAASLASGGLNSLNNPYRGMGGWPGFGSNMMSPWGGSWGGMTPGGFGVNNFGGMGGMTPFGNTGGWGQDNWGWDQGDTRFGGMGRQRWQN